MSRDANFREQLRVKPGEAVDLTAREPSDLRGWEKDDAKQATAEQLERLNDLHDRFWAQASHGLLVVLQGLDASGKDGAIRNVVTAFNPQGCYVASFKVPTPEEAAHDFLWRVHRQVPGKGEIAIFNRSHYEEVLVVRVNELVTREVWSGRYELIRDFEKLLTATGTVIVKFMLHIDRDEQRDRLQSRLDNPKKRWKFSLGDLDVRKQWDHYMEAYEDALAKTSTDDAPWYVIPSNKNWFRDLAISTILANTLAALDPQYPQPTDLPETLKVE